MRLFRPLISLAMLLCLSLPASAALPRPTNYVTDQAAILSNNTELKVNQFLREFEQSDSTQIAVLTVTSLEGNSLEQYAIDVFSDWKIGQQDKDNGLLLLIAKDERKIRIEVGYGLEGRLTDLLAGRIIDQEISPRFKQGDFDGGVISGVLAMAEAVRGEYSGSGRTVKKKKSSPFGLFFLLFFLGPLIGRLTGRRTVSSRRGGIYIGGPFGGGGFGGGGFGGGGFSGGGGGGGGGGASGGW